MTKRVWAALLAVLGLAVGLLVGVWVWNGRAQSATLLDRLTIGGFLLAELGTILTTIGLVLGVQVAIDARRVKAIALSGGEATAAGGNIRAAKASRAQAGSAPDLESEGSRIVRAAAKGEGAKAKAAGGDIIG